MKRLVLLFAILFTFDVYAEEYVEGKHYIVVADEVSKTKKVTEFFSFYCPACYRLEPMMAEIKTMLPSEKQFIKNHVDGMPGRDIKIEQMLTKANLVARLLNVEQKIVDAIFNYIHQDRAKFKNLSDVKRLFKLHGIDEAKFDKTYNGFNIKMMFSRLQKNMNFIRSNGFSAVPTLLINDKYVVNSKQVRSIDDYKKLVKYLINKAD